MSQAFERPNVTRFIRSALHPAGRQNATPSTTKYGQDLCGPKFLSDHSSDYYDPKAAKVDSVRWRRKRRLFRMEAEFSHLTRNSLTCGARNVPITGTESSTYFHPNGGMASSLVVVVVNPVKRGD